MKKFSTIILSLLFVAVFTLPIFASAATSPGVKPGSFFYFFDTSFEKIGLFFTFSPEKKARRALQYADERLAEIEVIAEEKDTDAVKKAISNYENNVALAAEKSKEVTDKAKAENLLTVIEDNAAKNQEVLAGVLAKVPEEAREAILQAISASRKGQEEAAKQIAELKGEVEKLKQEVEELKKEADDPRADEVEKLKKEVEALKEKQKTVQPVLKQSVPATQQPQETKKPEEKFKTVTLPSGAVVETDANGNIIRYIKEAPISATTQTPIIPVTPPTTTPQTETLEIVSVNLTVSANSAKFAWQTNKPTESKVFISGENFPVQAFYSENGPSTHHMTTITGLSGGRAYLYEIEAVIDDKNIARKHDGFQTASLPSAPQPEVKKELKIMVDQAHIGSERNYFDIVVYYLENGQSVNTIITLTSDDNGLIGGDDGVSDNTASVSSRSYRCMNWGCWGAQFVYVPASSTPRTLTATANGASQTFTDVGLKQVEGFVPYW